MPMSEKRSGMTARRRSRQYFQLSLRTLFVLMTLAAIWLGVAFKRARDQRQPSRESRSLVAA